MDRMRVLQVFDESVKQIREMNVDKIEEISTEMLSLLDNLFRKQFRLALSLVEAKQISMLQSPTGRQVFQVVSKDMIYICNKNVYHCNCYDFRNQVMKQRKHLLCKHLIATRLAEAMNVCPTVEVSEEEMKAKLLAFTGEQIKRETDESVPPYPLEANAYLKWVQSKKTKDKENKDKNH